MEKSVIHQLAADLVYEARQELGLSQEQFADLLEMPRRTIVRWESGHHIPDWQSRQKISEALGRDVFAVKD